MRSISVPVSVETFMRYGSEKMLRALAQIAPARVLISVDTLQSDDNIWFGLLEKVKQITEVLHQAGYEVGCWSWSSWLSGAKNEEFVQMQGTERWNSGCHPCFLDANFSEFVGTRVEEMAQTGVDLILFDDDFKFGYWIGVEHTIGCLCPLHRSFIAKEAGLPTVPTAEALQEMITAKAPNPVRSAWLKANGTALKNHAAVLRRHLDAVNPNCRMGVCSEMSLWDYSGVDTPTVAHILAGGTKPFYRLIGAPYWAVERAIGHCRLQHVIELERMERSWCPEGDEILCEGDVYPRPRHKCPAAYLELFDTALLADGRFDGILKYAMDYFSDPDYETGYLQKHLKNLPLYEAIEAVFAKKQPVGVRVYETEKRIEHMEFPEAIQNNAGIEDLFFSPAAKMLSDGGIPTVYGGLGVAGIAFGENVKAVGADALRHGLILDAAAARILTGRGIDVGLRREVGVFTPNFEIDAESGNEIWLHGCGMLAMQAEIAPQAIVLSRFCESQTDSGFPAAYLYRNQNGQPFLVFAFDAYFNGEGMNRHYLRSGQIARAVQWFGSRLPAFCCEEDALHPCCPHPDLYLMTKRSADGAALAVGLWNMSADSVDTPFVRLDRPYREISCPRCEGVLQGDTVRLSELPAFAFAGFEVKL